MSATHKNDFSTVDAVLHMALELSEKEWKLAFSTGTAQKPRRREIPARDIEGLRKEIVTAKERFDLPAETRVVSCYEAGRDGFWLHRFLLTAGVENQVVDSSSIQVERRGRRAKTDRLDAEKLLAMLIRWQQGEHHVWRVVNIPTVEEETARQLHRELETLKGEQTAHGNRIKGLLAGCGPQRFEDAKVDGPVRYRREQFLALRTRGIWLAEDQESSPDGLDRGADADTLQQR
jgi:transposase